jgi:hypothetical protein
MANSSNYSHVQRQAARKSTPQLPMNWFKFLIYCQLFLTALSELSNAYLYLTGNVYASEPGGASAFYAQFPPFRIINLLFGAAGIFMAAFAIYTRFQLSGFKTGAPSLLLKFNLTSVCVTMVYHLLYAILSGYYGVTMTGREIMSYISLFGIGIAYYLVNKSYFGKREFMFNR